MTEPGQPQWRPDDPQWMRTVTGPHEAPVPARHQPQPVQAVWARPARRRRHGWLSAVLITLCAAAFLLLALVLTLSMGSAAFLACGILALIPLGICLLGIGWIDRWEPEPRLALFGAFLWGAGMSTGLALLLGPGVTELLVAATSASADFVGPVLQAPLLEEFTKGLGVLILLFIRRSHFDGPIDGIVYAGTVAAGFAFTENIVYFGSAYLEAGAMGVEVVVVFVLRGLLSPFAHVLFTACLGVALGLAARRGGAGTALAAFAVGLVPAVGGHMLWNGGPLLFFDNFLVFYVLLQVPLFAAAIGAVWFLRRAERRLTERRLADYAAAGWFTREEVAMLATSEGRSQAAAWAGRFGAKAVMKDFERAATRLAFTRQRIIAGYDVGTHRQEERRLLEEAGRHRGRLFLQAQAAQAGALRRS